MESRSKTVEELPTILSQPTKSSEHFVEELLDEEQDALGETYMGSLIDLIYQTWITNTFFIKNLRMMIGCIQTYMLNQRKGDPIRMREAKMMKDTLMSLLEVLKKKGMLNTIYSMEELNQFFSTSESKHLRSVFMEDFMTTNTFFEWLHDLKEFVKRQTSTSVDTSIVDCEILIFTLSPELTPRGGMDALFASTSKQKTDGISQYVTKLDNGRLYTVGTPGGQTGHRLMRLDVYDIHGFVVDKRFVVKEIAVLKNGNTLTHYIFTGPMPWRFLTKSDQSHASWLISHHHGLRWNDGVVPYRMAQRLISEAVLGESEAIVYVKGSEKREWLSDILNNDDVLIETIDIHYEDIESLKTLDATNTFRCGRHSKHCALENVLKLFKRWTRFQSK
ncbi:hypothetical protein ALC60_12308 [Trachymyrmex zeteki]|uniref:Uncharacterized protein n=1 Tax=Mycetomoellerius zeteki TaxID=64791 RepID=A0A151WLE5_9HYME|nr:hypothetical protein ALC60_12308 [Trachymyrmex zeteki]